MELHLIRHPKTAAPDGICLGRRDWPLAEKPDSVAAQLQPHLPPHYYIYSSPSERCAALARLLGSPSFDDRLLEIDFGDWEGLPFADLPPDEIERWANHPFGFQPPNGESAAEMALRVLEWWQETRERRLDAPAIVVVAHAGPLKVLTGHLLGLPRERWLALDVACSRSTRFDIHPWGAVLKWFNR
ncbi:MAG: alpha-ribazole phosphatase family protein [Hydrogenophilus sp.]|nr:alpha-ribazole phosphatase family protein [Hydrogenophilus sp.]